jgi:hypothetical protein
MRPSSFLASPYGGVRVSAGPHRTTTRGPLPTSTIQPGTTVTTTQIVAEAVTEVAQGESVPFSPKEWIQQFDRNQTHVKVPFGNHSRELLWQKENVNLLNS